MANIIYDNLYWIIPAGLGIPTTGWYTYLLFSKRKDPLKEWKPDYVSHTKTIAGSISQWNSLITLPSCTYGQVYRRGDLSYHNFYEDTSVPHFEEMKQHLRYEDSNILIELSNIKSRSTIIVIYIKFTLNKV